MLFHSLACFEIRLRVKMWSLQDLPFRKPTRSLWIVFSRAEVMRCRMSWELCLFYVRIESVACQVVTIKYVPLWRKLHDQASLPENQISWKIFRRRDSSDSINSALMKSAPARRFVFLISMAILVSWIDAVWCLCRCLERLRVLKPYLKVLLDCGYCGIALGISHLSGSSTRDKTLPFSSLIDTVYTPERLPDDIQCLQALSCFSLFRPFS